MKKNDCNLHKNHPLTGNFPLGECLFYYVLLLTMKNHSIILSNNSFVSYLVRNKTLPGSTLSTIMKNFLLTYLFIFSAIVLQAQIQGPLSGSSFTTVVIPGSNRTWTNPGNATTSDDIYSTFGNIIGGVGSFTDYLVATNFGFSIPSGVTITGIIVEVERSDLNFRTADYSVRIVKGGTVRVAERAGGSSYPFSDSYQSYGNAGDLWGETWTDADINAANFGVAIAAQRSVAGGTTGGRVDHIRIIVFYDFTILPVKLLHFSALRKDNSVAVTWITTDEINMNRYEVERSINARDFINIKSVTSLDKPNETKYAITDNNPLSGISYYRLKTVEDNGTVKYSKIISLQYSTGNAVSIYPTVWKSGSPLNITNPEKEKLTIYFFTTSGQLTCKAVTKSNGVPTELISKEKGILFFRITNEEGKICGSGKLIAN